MTTKPFFLLLTLICLFGISINSFASKPGKPATSAQATELMHQNKSFFFEENRGQLTDPAKGGTSANRNTVSDIKYYGHSNGVYVYCKPGMLSFVFTKTEKEPEQISEATGQPVETQCLRLPLRRDASIASLPSKISTSRMDLVLIGSNPSESITATDQQEYYENFYTTGDANHGITNVHTYKTVIYKNIYPNIDMILKADGVGMEYSFLVHPGGNVSDIQLRWDGAGDKQNLGNGGIKYISALGSMVESAPRSFVEGKLVASSFMTNGFNFGFKVERYDTGKDLLIDPTLNWGTYFGGSDYDIAYSVSTDGSGNVYITGVTYSDGQIATSGAHQIKYAGGMDAFLAKFNFTGGRVWATFYGGTGDDEGLGVGTEGSGMVYITGQTTSTNGIATTGAYQTSHSGGTWDAFLARFNSSGAISWATFYGGNGEDGASAVSIDTSGNLYIAGTTSSDSGIATSGAYQTSYGSPTYGIDFLAKFSSAGTLSWGTYYEGGILAIKADGSGNLYITGYTQSSSGIATSGAYRTAYGGGNFDAFLTKFSSAGALSWSTYYGGNYDDEAYGVSTDVSGNVYITGYTTSTKLLASSGAYQTSFGGAEDAFLAKFSSSGALSWSTYYGGSGDENGSGVSTDDSANIYITGNSSSGIGSSGLLAEFNSKGILSWATYYGNDNPEGISVDVFGNIYITGYTASTKGISTSGAYQTSYAGGYFDAFLAKFSYPYQNDAGITSVKSPSGALCAGSQTIKAILKNYGTSTLSADSIYWTVNGTSQTPVKWTGSLKTDSTAIVTIGPYNFSSGSNVIVSWSVKPNGIKDSVPFNDTAKITITFNALPTASVISNTPICSGSAISIGAAAVTGSSYSWASSASGFSSTSSNPSVKPASTASYTLTEINTKGCVKSNAVTITVDNHTSLISDTAICEGNIISLGGAAVTKSSYSWTSWLPGFLSKSANPSVSPTATTTYYITETDSNGCVKKNHVTITVNPLPVAAVISDTAICSGSSISIGASTVAGSSYSWISSPPGFTSTISNPTVSAFSITSYSLTETNFYGCVKSDTVAITINPLPKVNVVSKNSICFGSAISIGDTAVPKSSYSWTSSPSGFASANSNPIVSPTTTTSYTLAQKDSNGCSNSDSVTITVNPLPAAAVIPNTALCKGVSISIGAPVVPGSSYTWNSSPSGFSSTSSNPSVSPVSTTSYTVTETDSNKCVNTNSLIILVNPLPAASVVPDTSICSGSAISIGSAAVTGSTYLWTSFPSGFNSTYSNPTVSPTYATSYTLTETNSGGCFKSDTVTIKVNQLPAATVIPDTSICSGSAISIGAAAISGSSYSWTSSASGFSSSSNPSVSPTSTASYTLTETNANGCVKSNSVIITVHPLPNAFWVEGNLSKIYYFHAIDSLLSITSYIWDFGDSSAHPGGFEVTHIFPKNKIYTVKLKVTDTFGCTNEDDSDINVTISGIGALINGKKLNLQIYPNPFTSKTLINFFLPQASNVKITVLDAKGNVLFMPMDKMMSPGPNNVEINASEAGLSPGTYFVNIEINGEVISKKIIKLE